MNPNDGRDRSSDSEYTDNQDRCYELVSATRSSQTAQAIRLDDQQMVRIETR